MIQHVSHSDARYIGYKHKLKAGGYSLVKLVQYSNFNRKLPYEVKKAEMTIKGYATEYLLYHGTRKTDPRIVAENGLDIQYASTKSSLGPAIYGSVDINYCHAGKYSHRYYDRGLRRNLNVLIVYRCLTGRVLKINKSLDLSVSVNSGESDFDSAEMVYQNPFPHIYSVYNNDQTDIEFLLYYTV